jgi:hypothetical protein
MMIVKINGHAITTQFHAIDALHLTPHKGIDVAMTTGEPVHSIGDGVVTATTDEGSQSFGKAVHVHMNDGHDAIYAHLSAFNVQPGQTVHQGDVIGFAGSTGHSTGPHLHLQVMNHGTAIDPVSYVAAATTTSHPWWDVADNVKDAIKHAVAGLFHDMMVAVADALGVILPTLCCVGIVWWMVPFFPKSDWGPKLVGTCGLLYMFYVLIRGAYS